MIRYLRLQDNKIVDCPQNGHEIMVVTAPDEAEKRLLIDEYKLDAHTLNSALDPDELSRIEFEPEHVAMIYKNPRNYSSEDNFLFKVMSIGLFLFKDKIIVVMNEDLTLFVGRTYNRVQSLPEVALKLLYSSVVHFTEHLKAISSISDELENLINQSMENKYLLNMFTLEKSLVFFLRAINSNAALLEKLKANALRLGFTPEQIETLDDTIIENSQCNRQAEIYSNILASLMDARASIVSNNLNLLIKKLTFITIALMLPTLVVSIFSMNVDLPFNETHHLSFWFVISLAFASILSFWAYWRYNKW